MPELPSDSSSAPQYQQQYLNPTTSFIHDPHPSSSNKENAAPPDYETNPQAPPSLITQSSSSTERIPDSLPASQTGTATASLPAPLLLILQSIQSTLRSLFASKPPHTIQRLAELILRPNAHYRTLPSYLRALDRVVSVTSSADIFPFPMQSGAAAAQPNGTLNGAETTFNFSDSALGSDEALGGALLTPIPWLNNASSPGPEGAGIDEVSIVTSASPLHNQLLTQPADPLTQQGVDAGDSMLETEMPAEPTDEVPHARGPSLLGVEDMGLQDGKGVEMTLLNKDAETSAPSVEETTTQESAQDSSSGTEATDSADQNAKDAATIAATVTDSDGDITLSDEPTIPQGDQDEKN
ncbi:uncharacterized protein DSM5745_01490 [Aspergillus mulundensis]|uniref:Protein phosphatase 4 core regulatory subunit R2 n=1 Tax=Aspergillus mulundensis TaxID=1810919 RepID=A0A3D8T850_9EURO|nr:Uncharacterized protein DSM5745_01490 [Aspergillus mulundensis]RDW94168.1 Uncharacterized protein DSM5745_01490 [Aspergillus mulundensis]